MPAAAGAALLLATTVAPADAEPNHNTSAKLRAAVTPARVAERLSELEEIAAANAGTRASGTPGYAASRDYVVDKLRAAGYSPTVQEFEFPFFRELTPAQLSQVAPDPTTYDNPADFSAMTYSGTGDVTAAVVPVDTALTPTETSTSGCETADFAAFPAGAIALVQRGTCTFGSKAVNAEEAGAAGAAGVIVFNRGTAGATGSFAGTLGAPDVTIPVVGASFGLGQDLADPAGSTVRMQTDTESGFRTTWNVLAETAKGDPATLQEIALYLNFDMVGSPNYVRFVYDGHNSRFPAGPAAAEGPEGSGEIEQLFHDYFGSQKLESEETPFSGRSDDGPFIAEGVPAGGLFTGAEGVKTAEQAEVFGGAAGVAYDPCYHQACDDIENVNMDAVDEMSDAIAHAILTYAMDTRPVNGKGKGHPVSPPGQQTTGVPTGPGSTSDGGLHDDHGHERDAS